MKKAPLRVETARLTLSAPAVADAEEVFRRYASDPEVTTYLAWPRHRTLADTEGFLWFSAAQWVSGVGPYLVRARDDGRLLGSTGLVLEPNGEASTGYVLAKDAWGKGFATEALRAMVDVARDMGLARVYALCHPENRASARVLEKCGFMRDAAFSQKIEMPNLAPGVPRDVLRFNLDLHEKTLG